MGATLKIIYNEKNSISWLIQILFIYELIFLWNLNSSRQIFWIFFN